jgi:hypothetical protein
LINCAEAEATVSGSRDGAASTPVSLPQLTKVGGKGEGGQWQGASSRPNNSYTVSVKISPGNSTSAVYFLKGIVSRDTIPLI